VQEQQVNTGAVTCATSRSPALQTCRTKQPSKDIEAYNYFGLLATPRRR
jgi:hypothetical protein